jgi:hypothetical protein
MDWKYFKEIKKEQHQQRVAKTPDRLSFAIKQFEKLGINIDRIY